MTRNQRADLRLIFDIPPQGREKRVRGEHGTQRQFLQGFRPPSSPHPQQTDSRKKKMFDNVKYHI